jgi:hypothetical protein
MPNKIDIHTVLSKVDAFDVKYFDGLTAEEKKDIQAFPLMLWLSGCKSKIQLRQLNAFLNSIVFAMPSGHQGLLYKMACISSDGKPKKYTWVRRSSSSKKYSATVGVLRQHYRCSSATALSYVPLVDYEFVSEIAMALGEQDDVLKKIKKELS